MSPSPTHCKSTSPLEQYRYIDMRMVFCGVVHVHPHVHVWLCKHAVYTLQEFLLSAEVCVPRVSVCVPELELGHCLLDHSLSSTLTLCNTTHSALPWTIHPSHGTLYIPLSMYCMCVTIPMCVQPTDLQGVIRASPSSGVLLPHINTDTPRTQCVHLTFTPE